MNSDHSGQTSLLRLAYNLNVDIYEGKSVNRSQMENTTAVMDVEFLRVSLGSSTL
jgi:hypothetical protein